MKRWRIQTYVLDRLVKCIIKKPSLYVCKLKKWINNDVTATIVWERFGGVLSLTFVFVGRNRSLIDARSSLHIWLVWFWNAVCIIFLQRHRILQTVNAVGVIFPPTKVRSFIHEWPHFVNRTHFSPHSTSGRTRSWPLFIVSHFLLPTKSLKYVICSLSCILIMAKVSQYKCQELNDTGSRGRLLTRPPSFTVSTWGRHNNDIKK